MCGLGLVGQVVLEEGMPRQEGRVLPWLVVLGIVAVLVGKCYNLGRKMAP